MKKTATPNIIRKTSTEIVESVKNITLDGRSWLLADHITSTVEVVKEFKDGEFIKTISRKEIDSTTQILSFPLREITPDELAIKRKLKRPSFVLKENGKLYYAEIYKNINFMSSNILGPHKCAMVNKECSRLSAASDADGGCAKVRNLSTRIEIYPWITKGYETFCTKTDSFVVVECSHYTPITKRPKISLAQKNAAKLGLAQHMWEHVESLDEAKKLANENLKRDNRR